DMLMVALLMKQGYKQGTIATMMGRSRTAVHRDWKAVREEWKAERLEAFESILDDSYQRIMLVIQQAFEAWERSKQPVGTKMQSGGEGKGSTASIKRTTQPGDPAFLKIVTE